MQMFIIGPNGLIRHEILDCSGSMSDGPRSIKDVLDKFFGLKDEPDTEDAEFEVVSSVLRQ